MINVGIVSNNEKVAFNMASVVCKVGAHCERITNYSFEKIKSFNIVVFDLDNIGDLSDTIKKTSGGFRDIVVAGFSRSQEIMDDFRPIMNVKIKPFRNEHILSFIEDLKHVVKSDTVVNTEQNPIYTALGENTTGRDPLNTDVFSNEDLSLRLSKIINEKYHGPSEKEFLEQIQMDVKVAPIPKETFIEIKEKPQNIDLTDTFIDDALIMYRAKKLRKLHLTPDEIKNRVKALMMFDAAHGATKEKIDSSVLEAKFEQANRITEETLSVFDKESHVEVQRDFSAVKIDIQDQRKEAVYERQDPIEQPIPTPNTSKLDNFTETELKYIRQSPSSEPKKPEPVKTNTNLVPQNAPNGIVIDRAELSKKVQGTMSPEQIEKLRKLGVKI